MIRRAFKRVSKSEIAARKKIIESAKEINIDLTRFDVNVRNNENNKKLQRQALVYISKGKSVPKRIKNAIVAKSAR